MSVFLLPYDMASESAAALSEMLGFKRIKREGSKWKPAPNKLVINWGCPTVPEHMTEGVNWINPPHNVNVAANKVLAFNQMRECGVPIPEYALSREEALLMFDNGIKEVVCRTDPRGHGGEGIVIASSPEELVDAPLYTQYIPKKSEYRVHVMRGQVIDVQRKARSREIADQDVNWKVRNHKNGFVFIREDAIPACVFKAATSAVKAIGLYFGAVDVIYNQKNNLAFVLEVNTAPGLTGTTLEIYANYFSKL